MDRGHRGGRGRGRGQGHRGGGRGRGRGGDFGGRRDTGGRVGFDRKRTRDDEHGPRGDARDDAASAAGEATDVPLVPPSVGSSVLDEVVGITQCVLARRLCAL